MADVTMNANFDNYTSFTAKFGVVINSVVVDPEVTEESSNPVASSGIYKFVEEEIQKGGKVKDVIVEDKSIVDEEGNATIPLADEETKGLVGEGYGFEVKNGYPQAAVYPKTIFNQLKDFLFISKGTLLNVLSGFQALLESGKNIKTINNQSILGEGNYDIHEGMVDDVLVDGASVLGPDKIAKIPRASSTDSGTIKIGNGAQVTAAGTIRATALTKANYDAANGNTFVGKTTLENVLDPIRDGILGVDDKIKELELFKFPNVTIIGTPTINNGQISDFSATSYLKFPFLVDFRSQPFEINMAFTTGSNVVNQENIFDSDFGLAFAIRSGKFVIAISTNGTSWDLGEGVGSLTVQPYTTYYVKISWNGSQYVLYYSFDGTTYTADITKAGTSQPYPKQIYIGVGENFASVVNHFSGTINLNNANVKVNGEIFWTGMDDAGISTRADVSLSNIDADGEEKIKEVAETEAIKTDLTNVKADLSELDTEVQSKSDKANTVFTVNGIAPINGNVTVPTGTPEQYDELVTDVTFLKSNVGGGNLVITPNEIVTGKKYHIDNYSTNHMTIKDDSYYYSCSPVDVSNCVVGSDISINASLVAENGVFLFDDNMTAIDYIIGDNAVARGYSVSSAPQKVTLKITERCKFIVSSIRSALITDVSQFNVSMVSNTRIDELEKDKDRYILFDKVVGKNILNPQKIINGYLQANGAIYPTDNYQTSDFIELKQGQSVTVSPRMRFFATFNADKEITMYNSNVTTGAYTYTATNDCLIRATFFTSDTNKQIEYNDRKTFYREYYTKDVLQDNVHLSPTMIVDSGNFLNGKKWCPCGDSFTEYTNAFIENGTYKGRMASYPYLIGNRTGLDVDERFFLSGRTLAYPSDGSFANSLTNPNSDCYYQNIPVDVDYVTIMLGINDCQHNGSGTTPDGEIATGVITLGTIDDTTTSTYYGAYNTVLGWLRENRPFAHVGIIVTNGTELSDWTNAQIEIAKKWGYPYINLNGDERTPAMIRPYNPNMSAELKEQIKRIQSVDYDGTKTGSVNWHPNAKAHEYESTFIENWLRSI